MRRRAFMQAISAGLGLSAIDLSGSCLWGSSPGGSSAPALLPASCAFAAEPSVGMTLGHGAYGMPKIPSEDAIGILAEIGFDSIEFDCRREADADPQRVDEARRKTLRKKLGDSGLAVRALMIERSPSADDKQHAAALDELKRAAQLAHDLSPNRPPLLQTVLGGGAWDEVKQLYVERLADWARVAGESRVTLAIKPHRFGAMSQPVQAVWLFEQLEKPAALRMVYDYSHYAFRDLSLEETVKTALPYTAHVAVKDAVEGADKKVSFVLAGERGTIDFAAMLRLLSAGGYRGDVCCEVSRQVWSQPGFDPTNAARTCYKNMAQAFEQAGVKRAKPS